MCKFLNIRFIKFFRIKTKISKYMNIEDYTNQKKVTLASH